MEQRLDTFMPKETPDGNMDAIKSGPDPGVPTHTPGLSVCTYTLQVGVDRLSDKAKHCGHFQPEPCSGHALTYVKSDPTC